NTWQRLPQPPWMPIWDPATGGAMHGYDHSAIDPQGRGFYHRPFGTTPQTHRYDMDTEVWTDLPSLDPSAIAYDACCIGLEYFPEMHALIYVSAGDIAKWDKATNQWSRINQSTLPMGGYHNFAECNPVHHVAVFGGGIGDGSGGERKIYELSSA